MLNVDKSVSRVLVTVGSAEWSLACRYRQVSVAIYETRSLIPMRTRIPLLPRILKPPPKSLPLDKHKQTEWTGSLRCIARVLIQCKENIIHTEYIPTIGRRNRQDWSQVGEGVCFTPEFLLVQCGAVRGMRCLSLWIHEGFGGNNNKRRIFPVN